MWRDRLLHVHKLVLSTLTPRRGGGAVLFDKSCQVIA